MSRVEQTTVARIGDYPVVRVLREGETFLATGSGGRRVVLKRLPDDCLYEGGLHVSIKERLERIREVPHAGVANLYGVERDGDFVFAVWEYIDGTPLSEYLTTSNARGQMPDFVAAGRELVLSVEGLAKVGLVHGAIHGRNVFWTRDGIRLTHLSPLLWTDPAADADAVVTLLLDCLNRRYTPADLPVHKLLTRAAEEGCELATLGPLLACPPDSPLSPQSMGPKRGPRKHIRARAVLAALIAVLIGVTITGGILIYFERIPTGWWIEFLGRAKAFLHR